MGKRSLEVETFNCTYCGFEDHRINQVRGQNGSNRYICGECMIKAFDKGLGYEPKPEPEVSEPLSEGSPADKGTAETKQ